MQVLVSCLESVSDGGKAQVDHSHFSQTVVLEVQGCGPPHVPSSPVEDQDTRKIDHLRPSPSPIRSRSCKRAPVKSKGGGWGPRRDGCWRRGMGIVGPVLDCCRLARLVVRARLRGRTNILGQTDETAQARARVTAVTLRRVWNSRTMVRGPLPPESTMTSYSMGAVIYVAGTSAIFSSRLAYCAFRGPRKVPLRLGLGAHVRLQPACPCPQIPLALSASTLWPASS